MGRVIGSVVAGYVAMFVTVFLLFTAAWFALGADGAFMPATFQTTALWIALSVFISLAAAVDGGYVAAVVSKSDARALWGLVGLVVVLGLLFALPVLNQADTPAAARGATVTMAEAMQQARQPVWIALANPVIGAVGAIVGFRLRRANSHATVAA